MKLNIVLLCLMLPASSLLSQAVDTSYVTKILNLEAEVDSLRQLVHSMSLQQRAGMQMTEGAELDSLLTLFGEAGDDIIPADRRSRRKRVDQLLKIIKEQPGQLRFNGGATATIQGNPDTDNGFATAVGSFDFFAHTSFGNHTLLFFDLEAVGGNGPDEHVFGLAPLNGDAGSTQAEDGFDRLTVLEAWAEFSFLENSLTLTAGKIDLTNYFDNNDYANDETSQFISGAFVNSAALPVPSNSPGLRLRTTVLTRFFLQLGLVKVENSGNNLFDEIFKIGSLGFKVFPETNWEANLRLYTYLHPAVDNSVGYGLSFDESVYGMLQVFARYNHNSARLAQWFGISSAWSIGGQILKRVAARRLVAGIAYGRTKPLGHALKSERIGEIYVRMPFNQWVASSAHIQALWNAGGMSRRATILGIRTHFNF